MAGSGLLRMAPVALGTLIVPLDSAVNVAFPAMVAAFDLAVPEIQWIVICYVLTYGSLMLAVGRLGDIFGHARVFRFGLAWSAVAYLLLTLVPGYEALLACRALQGVGAALVLGCGPALATALFPETMRARALAAYAATVAAGSAIGPLAGGLLVEVFGWQAVYWFRAPFALVALLLSAHLPEAPRGGPREPFDIPGALLLVSAVATTLLAVNQAPTPVSLLLAGVATACAAGFVWWSHRAPRPIIDLGLFRRPGFAALNLANAILAFAGFAVMLLVPFYLSRIAGLEAASLGLVLAASPAGGVLGSWLGAKAVTRLGSRGVLMAGTVLNAVGLLGIVPWGAGTAVPLLVAALAVQGLGLGLFTLAYADRVTEVMRPEDRGVAGSLTMLTRTFGVVGAASLQTMLLGAREATLSAQGHPPAEAFLGAFGWAFLVAGGLSLLALPLLVRQASRRG